MEAAEVRRGTHTPGREVPGLHYEGAQGTVRFFVTEESAPEGAIFSFMREGVGFSVQMNREGIVAFRDAANDALAALDA